MSKKYEVDLSILNEIFDFTAMVVVADTPQEAIKEFIQGLREEVEDLGYDIAAKIGDNCITEIVDE